MRPRLAPSVLLSPSETGYDAFDTRTRLLHHLNPTASLLAELCEGSRSIDDLRQLLLPLTGEDGWPPCAAWIEQACRDGLLLTDEPRDAPTADALVRLSAELRHDDRVLEAFICQERACELKPDVPANWCALGELAHIVGRRHIARDAYERYLESCPDDAEVEHILIALRDEPPPERASRASIEQLYSRFASFYDTNMKDDLGYKAPELLRAAVARALGRSEVTVLDLGCGTGLAGERLRPTARHLVGVDLSAEMIARARQRGIYDALYESEITEWLVGADGEPAYDVVVSCDTLIYFGDLRPVLRAAAARIVPGGVMAFTVEKGDRAPFALADSGRFTHHPDHVRDAVREAGLSIVSMEEAVLRQEYGRPVAGLMVCAKRQG